MRLKHFLSVFLTLLTLSIGQVWADPDYSLNESWDFGTSGNSNWSGHSSGYCGGCGSKNSAFNVYKANISNFSNVNFSNHENVSLTIYVKAGTNNGTNSYTVKLIDSDGNQVSTYSSTKTNGMGSGSNSSSAQESYVTFSPTQAFSGYKIEFQAKGYLTRTSYVLTYDDKASGCTNQVTITNDATTNVANGSFTVDKTGAQDACSALSVVVTPTAATHYHVASVSATSGETGVDNGDGTWTITYAANSTGSSTINVVFEEDNKYTLNYHDGSGDNTKINVYEGTNLINALGTPAASCDESSTTFIGWSTTKITTKTNTAPTFVAENEVVNSTTASEKYYAVYAKGGSTFKLSYTDNSTTYYAGKKGSGTYLDAESSLADAAEFGFESATGGYYVYYIDGNDKVYIGGTGGNTTLNTATNTPGATNYVWTYTENEGILQIKIGSRYLGLNSSTKDRFSTYTSWYSLTKHAGSVSDYITNCCSPLGSINGSFSLTHPFGALSPEKFRPERP